MKISLHLFPLAKYLIKKFNNLRISVLGHNFFIAQMYIITKTWVLRVT